MLFLVCNKLYKQCRYWNIVLMLALFCFSHHSNFSQYG
nr:MAG TPA: hypothetical protein [Crassvirales sp.]